MCGMCIGILRRLRKLVPLLTPATLRTVVTAFILSRLDHGNGLYIGLQEGMLDHLQTTMNDAAQLLYNLLRRAHAKPLLRELHWLPIRQRSKFKGLCIAHKTWYGNAPDYIKERLTPYILGRALRSSDAYLLRCPKWKKATMGGRSFAALIPQMWNTLPEKLRREPSDLLFRKQLKTILFAQALD